MTNNAIKYLVNLETLTEKSAVTGLKSADKSVNEFMFKLALYARFLRGLKGKDGKPLKDKDGNDKYSFRAMAKDFNIDAGNLNTAVTALERLEKYGLVNAFNTGEIDIRNFSGEKIRLANIYAGDKDKPTKKDKEKFQNALTMTRDALRNVTGGKDGKSGKGEKMVVIDKLVIDGKEYSGKIPESLFNQILEHLTLKK